MSEEQYAGVLKRTRQPAQNASGAPIPARKLPKYHNEPTNGYASNLEARRAAELQLLERSGAITELKEQQKWLLLPAQRDASGELLERECSYYADFQYRDANGELVVEDVKSEPTKTPEYRIKRKLLLWVHGVRIREIGR